MHCWHPTTALRVGTILALAILTVQNYYQFHQHYDYFFNTVLLQRSQSQGTLPMLGSMDERRTLYLGSDVVVVDEENSAANNNNATKLMIRMQHQKQQQNFEQETVEPQPRNRRQSLAFYEQEMEDLINRFYRPKYTTNQHLQLDIVTIMGIGGVLEMEDVRAREIWCLDKYYDLWRSQQPFSGQPFLEWLDHPYNYSRTYTHENGTTVTELLESDDCPRHYLNHRRFAKFNTSQIEASVIELRVLHQKLVQAVFVQSQQPVPEGTWDIVWDLNERLYLSKEDYIYTSNGEPFEYYRLGHCSVTHGRPVLFAGEVLIGPWGILVLVKPASGHYQPARRHMVNFFEWMKTKMGEPTCKKVKWMPCQSCEC